MKAEPTRALLVRAYDLLVDFPTVADLKTPASTHALIERLKTGKMARDKLVTALAAAVTKAGGSDGPNLTAARATLDAMDHDNRGAPIDRALVVAFTQLAAAVDANPTNANLWRRYLDAAAALTTVHNRGEADGKLAGLLDDLFSDAEVRDPETTGAQDARPTGRRNSRKTGPAVHAMASDRGRHGDGTPAKRPPRISRSGGQRSKAKRQDD